MTIKLPELPELTKEQLDIIRPLVNYWAAVEMLHLRRPISIKFKGDKPEVV
jgi:hypothetical protein